MSQYSTLQTPEFGPSRPVSDQAAAAASAAAAEASAAAALLSVGAAGTQATAAAASALSASGSAQSATGAAAQATQGATAAAASATAAGSSATAAEAAKTSILGQIAAAAGSASQAGDFATQAQLSAGAARASELSAGQSATTAAATAGVVAANAVTATSKATAAAGSAAAALISQNAAAGSATAADGSKTAAAGSATVASTKAAEANAAASAATAITASAAGIATSAATAAAAPFATAAAGSATTASVRASEAQTYAATATAQAAAALLSQNAAASSATAAQQAIIGLYAGDYAGGSLPATLSAAGRWVFINAAGGGYSQGDIAVYKGTSGQYLRLPAGFIPMATVAEALAGTDTTKAMNAARVNDRVLFGDVGGANCDVLFSDGGSSSRRVEWTLGSSAAIAGKSISVPFEFDVPATNPRVTAYVFTIQGANTDPAPQSKICLMFGTSGELILRADGVTVGTDFRQLAWAGFRAAYSGLRNLRGVVVFPVGDSTTSPVIYIQGNDATASFTATSGGSVNWMRAAQDATKFIAAYNWPSGRFITYSPTIGAMSAAEVLDWTQTGRLPLWCEVVTGTTTSVYTSNFASGADTFTATDVNQTTPSSVDGIGGEDDVLTAARTVSVGKFGMQRGSTILRSRRYRMTWKWRVPASNTNKSPNVGNGATPAIYKTETLLAGDTWVDESIEFATDPTDGTLAFYISGAAVGDALYVKSVALYPLGPIFRPVIQPCRVLDDAGTNRIAGVATAGMSMLTTLKAWRIATTVDMSSTGNKQLLGAALFETPLNQAIDSIETAHGVNGATYSVGDGTTDTAYTASAAQSSGRKRLTVANPFPISSTKTGIYFNVTVAGASETAVSVVIRGHRID